MNTQQLLCLGKAFVIEKYPGSFYFAENMMLNRKDATGQFLCYGQKFGDPETFLWKFSPQDDDIKKGGIRKSVLRTEPS